MKVTFRFLAALALAVPFCLAQAVTPPASDAPDAGARPPATAPGSIAPVVTDVPSSPDSAPAKISPKTYIVGPLDVLEIRVWNDPKMSGAFGVRPDGVISMPLIGEIKADGLSIPELTRAISDKLSTVMNDPEVNIQI